MKLFIPILLLGLLLSSCGSPENKDQTHSTGTEEEVQIAKWKALKNNFPEITIPYSINTDSVLNFSPYKTIDTAYLVKHLQIPPNAPGSYWYIGRFAREEYTLVLYGYQLSGISGVRLASFNKKGYKTDEILFWAEEWLDNPAGKSVSQSIIEKDGEIKTIVWQYASDEPTKEEIKNTNPSRKFYYSFEDGRFTNSDETAVEK